MARSNTVVSFTQNDDSTQTFKIGGQSVTFHPDMVDPTLRARAELHGWKQRISDKAALSRDPKTGKSATPEQKFAAVKAIIDHYESGADKWEMERAGGGGGGRSDSSYILQALANVQDVDLKTMSERVAANAEKRELTVDAYLKRVATSPAVAEEVARIKHGESEDADDILAELGEADDEEGEDNAD